MSETIQYKPVKTKFVWTGDGLGVSGAVTLEQIKRENNIAIYSRTTKDGRVSYEVVKIKKHNGYELGGQKVEPAETYPGASQWGINGFDAMNIERAEEKFLELVQIEKKKAEEEAHALANGITLKRRGRPKKVNVVAG